jgi:hypothetical protein
LHIDPTPLDAHRLATISADEVASLMNLPLQVDKPTPISGVTLSEPSELVPFIEKVTHVLNETGTILRQELNCSSLGKFVIEVSGSFQRAGRLVSALAHQFPGFRDAYTFDSQGTNLKYSFASAASPCGRLHSNAYICSSPQYPDVLLLKKAQFLAIDLHMSLPHLATFQWTDLSQLSIPSDNVIPSVLLHMGILQWSESTCMLDSKYTLSEADFVALRAASVVAVNRMNEFNPYTPKVPVLLGCAIWAWAKVGTNRYEIPRLQFKSTCMC